MKKPKKLLIYIGDISIKNILLTGGAGFVGRHFTRRCLELGYNVTLVDNIAKYTGGIDPANSWPLFEPTIPNGIQHVITFLGL